MRGAVLCLLLVCACSGAASPTPKAESPTPKAESPTPKAGSPTPTADPVATYLAQVNALCDDLLTKVIPLSHPGTYPIATYRRELPAHHALLVDFDAKLAKVPVPKEAVTQQAALKAYIAFANGIDHKRAVAAAKGQAAFDHEISAENAEFPNDPIAAARTAAGLAKSCDAR